MGFKLREATLPILPKGSAPLRILHFSDLHLTPKRRRLISDISSWRDLNPDLIISTGDFLAHRDAIETTLAALSPLFKFPGLYVFGSNDYFGPTFKNPFSYLTHDTRERKLGEKLPIAKLDKGLSRAGWKNLNQVKIKLKIKGISIEARGTDDAHLNLDDYSLVKGKRGKVDLSVGVTHAPYKRVLDAMAKDSLDLIFAGHTHGGQVRLPWFGGSRSLTTNCDLPNWRSRGLTKVAGEPYLNVSAGMGYNPYTPIRFFAPSEISLLTLQQIP
ncbi:MAG: metallophosphoesterase [Actinobacteria bacterium]|nr:metallophosphoesterase [Actinomycetota bacterium]